MQEKINWKNLSRSLHKQRSVLMLGPSLSCAKYKGEWMPLNEMFALHLTQLLEEEAYDAAQKRNLTYIAQ